MATKSENADIAVLQDQMATVKDTLVEVRSDVKSIVKALNNEYAKKSDLRNFKLITLPLAILLTAAITSLVNYYFFHSKPATSPEVQTTTVNTPSPTPAAPSTTTNNTTTNNSAQPSSSGGLLNSLPKVRGVN